MPPSRVRPAGSAGRLAKESGSTKGSPRRPPTERVSVSGSASVGTGVLEKARKPAMLPKSDGDAGVRMVKSRGATDLLGKASLRRDTLGVVRCDGGAARSLRSKVPGNVDDGIRGSCAGIPHEGDRRVTADRDECL